MNAIKIGQVLWMKVRLDYYGIFETVHPYLVINIDIEDNTVEIGQFHSAEGKEFEAISETNTIIFATMPDEPALPKDSFLQLDNVIKIEYFDGLSKYRKTEETLSSSKLSKALRKYKSYHDTHEIKDDHIVYMDRAEIEALNK